MNWLRAIAASSAVLGVAALTGCPDPQGNFDDFSARYDKIYGTSAASTGAGGACSAPAAGDADGDYLFALSAKIKPKQAVVFKMTVSTADAGNGTLTMSMKAIPLSATDQMTPVGSEVDLGPFTVNADGTFDADVGTLAVPGDANPITPGSEIDAKATLHGTLCAADTFICGSVEGMVTMPVTLDLAGSTFTMQKIDGSTYPAPVINCAMDPAVYATK